MKHERKDFYTADNVFLHLYRVSLASKVQEGKSASVVRRYSLVQFNYQQSWIFKIEFEFVQTKSFFLHDWHRTLLNINERTQCLFLWGTKMWTALKTDHTACSSYDISLWVIQYSVMILDCVLSLCRAQLVYRARLVLSDHQWVVPCTLFSSF